MCFKDFCKFGNSPILGIYGLYPGGSPKKVGAFRNPRASKGPILALFENALFAYNFFSVLDCRNYFKGQNVGKK